MPDIVLAPWLEDFLERLTGERAHHVSETRTFNVANALKSAGDSVDGAYPHLVSAVGRVRSGVSGRAEESFVNSMQAYVKNPGYLTQSANNLRGFSREIFNYASEIQFAKMMNVAEGIMLWIDFLFAFFPPYMAAQQAIASGQILAQARPSAIELSPK